MKYSYGNVKIDNSYGYPCKYFEVYERGRGVRLAGIVDKWASPYILCQHPVRVIQTWADESYEDWSLRKYFETGIIYLRSDTEIVRVAPNKFLRMALPAADSRINRKLEKFLC